MLLHLFNGGTLSFLLPKNVPPYTGGGSWGGLEKLKNIMALWVPGISKRPGDFFPALAGPVGYRWGEAAGAGGGERSSGGDPGAELLRERSAAESPVAIPGTPSAPHRCSPVPEPIGGDGGAPATSLLLLPNPPWVCARGPRALLGELRKAKRRFLVQKDPGQASAGQTPRWDGGRGGHRRAFDHGKARGFSSLHSPPLSA